MRIRVQVNGPLADAALVGRVVGAEAQQASTDALAFVRTAANQGVNRYLGTYDQGWQPVRHEHRTGSRFLVSTMENTAPNAAAQEDGRKAGHYIPIDPLVEWLHFRGYTPKRGTSEADYRGFAIGISRKAHAEGWRLANPPRPVGRALEREADRIAALFDQAGARIARRLG
jgi:hypothetical protein